MDSGIQCLAVEILEKILEECLPPDDITVMHPQLACLLQICRLWNKIILSQPSFWSYICIGKQPRTSVTLIQLWLQRSGTTYPLSLALDFYSSIFAPRIIDLIVPHIHRCKVLDLRPISREPFNALCTLPHGSMPILESAVISVYWPEKEIISLWKTIASSPLLSKVEITRLSSPSIVSLQLPWHQLTGLVVPGHMECSHLLEILRNCNILKQLVIGCPEESQLPNLSPITLPHLRYLGYTASASSCILPKLVAPILDTFSICFIEDPAENLPGIVNFLERSSCKLRSLIIVNHYIQSQFLIPLLKSRNLIHLQELRISGVGDHILREMTIADDLDPLSSPIIRPALRLLDLHIICEKVREGLLGSMLLCWVRAGIGLNHVRFGVRKQHHGFIQDFEVADQVRELGIHVNIDTWDMP